MKRNASFSRAAVSALLLASFLAGSAMAQHLISSKAGFVNRIDGKVYLTRQESQEGEGKVSASLGTQMRAGDRLGTEAGSFAELLLNPGSYIRINQKSELRALDTDLDRVRFELLSGSAMVEVGKVDKKLPIEIITPHGTFFIRKTGLQRIDVKEKMTSVAVRQGEIRLGTLEQVLSKGSIKIGRGKVAQLTGAAEPSLAQFDKDAIDEFDTWSFNRAEILMAANQRALRESSERKGALSYGWHFDPFYKSYTFIPRGSYWSPYGFGFFNSFNSCFDCYFPPAGYSYGNYGGAGGPTRRPVPSPRVVCGTDRNSIRNVIQGPRIDASGRGLNASERDFGRGPSSSQPSSSQPSSARPSHRSDGSRSGGGRGGAGSAHPRPAGGGAHRGGRPGPARPRGN
jgi:hypothetical protein